MTSKKSSKLTKRISAFTMAALVVMEQFAYFPQIVVSAARSASDSGSVEFPEVHNTNDVSAILSHSDQLIDNGDGTFTFTTELKSSYSYFDESRNWMQSQDGSYTLDKAGTYLIELWGGDGGDGSSMFPLSFKAGAGGKGGFVYGLLEVSEELAAQKKKLYYEIGSRGLSETRRYDSGGTGGIGGGAGDIVIFSVGAGGGYSAVYLMDENEELTDTVRNDPSKVLMIAGGGGGGGAGAALHTLPGLFGGDGKANGGDGGTFDSDISEVPNIENFVSSNTYVGKYYAGENGSTSGTKGAYVGKGGTDIPGEIVTSFIGYLAASSYPNDWQKTYHPELDRGVGGASNFRGGGGGAGFAGGSGGMQNEPVDARNVGGGGGGSSYVGKFSNFTPRDKGDANYFVNREDNTNSDTGGAVVIRHLSNNGTDYNYLNSIEVSGDISQYFDVVSTNGTPSGNSFTKTGSVAPVSSGLAKGQEKDKLTVSVTIRPKAQFMGGVRVPIFNEDGSTLTVTGGTKTTHITLGDDVKYVNVPYNISIKTKNSTVHQNDAITKADLYADGYNEIAYNSNDPMQDFITGISYEIARDGNAYTASGSFGYTISASDVGNTLYPDIRVTLGVPANVTPAKVGDAGSNVIVKKATLRCVDDTMFNVGGIELNAEKSLVYNEEDGTYNLTVDTTVASELTGNNFYIIDYDSSLHDKVHAATQDTNSDGFNHLPALNHQGNTRTKINSATYYSNQSLNITYGPGYYFVQVWGGDGGSGGYYGTNGTEGGSGGKGGYNCGYIYIEDTSNVSLVVGERGYDGAYFNNRDLSDKTGAYGGGCTWLRIGDDIMIAGGGGGGTPVYASTNGGNPNQAGKPGYSGYGYVPTDDKFDIPNLPVDPGTGIRSDGDPNNYEVYNGETAVINPNDNTDVTPGMAGGNYSSSGFKSDLSEFTELPYDPKEYFIFYNTTKPLRSGTDYGNGGVRVVRLGLKGGYILGGETVLEMTADEITALKASPADAISGAAQSNPENFTLKETISKYFDIVGIKVNNEELNDDYPISNGTDSTEKSVDFGITPTVTNASATAIGTESNYYPMPELTDYNHFTKTQYSYEYDFDGSGTVTFKLKPKDGFLGGNDVPLLIDATLSRKNGESADVTDIPPLDYTDFANVKLAGETLEPTITSDPIFVDYGSTITADIFSVNAAAYNALDPEDWQDDHADYGALSYEPTLGTKITADTDYILTASLEADSAASKAKVIDEVDTAERNFKVPVYVSYPIDLQLENLTSDAADKFPTTVEDTELVFDIYAADGYDLPAAENVEITNTDTTDPNAEPTVITDALVEKIGDKITVYIPRKSITGKVTVKASGVNAKHSVKYYYQMYDPVGKAISLEEAVDSKTFANGEVITGITYPSRPDEYPDGYDGYFWDWSIEADNNGDHIMGQEDVIIVGTYKPITYAIKVNYYTKESEDDPNPQLRGTYISPLDRTLYDNGTYKIALTKGAEFYIASPDFEGYVTDTPYIAGVVDDAFIDTLDETVDGHPSMTVAVYYTKVPDDTELIVNFVKCDVRGAPLGIASDKHIIGDNNYDYSGIQAAIDSWITSASEVVKITKVEEDASETKVTAITAAGTYNVYYRDIPKKVTINFYKNIGDAETVATRTAVIGREYSYDPDKDDYIPLPTAVDPTHEYRHTGWQTDSGDIIEDDMIVSIEGETIDLYAVWESSKITITVKYLYAWNVIDTTIRGTEANAQYVHQTDYGKSYDIISPTLQNYTAEPLRVTGVALADKQETVFYKDNDSSSITIKANIYSTYYQDSDSGNAADGAPLLKGGTFGLYAEDGTLIGTKQNTSGIVSWDNTEFDIRQGMTYTIKCTSPPPGYGDGEAEVTVGTSDGAIVIDDIEIFLDVSPFDLPYAGSTPMTGYTVFGLSTMVLAVFLLFVHMRSKTEEEKIRKT
ncbi:glycine-rich protein [Ruminococcus albus]|uniref:receptor protein-tyrosine kinase n=1 Tax=Ruminococcus albus TaxID=1264 RepID=A0A1I1DHF8_RUMAL|nr:glycine-rich protein [Ruminococcus albus]SFB73856.1 Glycine rich protein [Ruminococcus albus]